MSNTTEKRDTDVTLLNVRGSYVKFVTPAAVVAEPNGTKRYGLTVLLPKSDKTGKAKLDAAIAAVKKANPKTKFLPSNIFLKDGDSDERTKPEYADHWFFAANRNESQGPPDCYGKKKSAGKLSKDEVKELFYSGCRLNVVVGVFKPKGWDKVCASIEIAQFAGDDERFGDGSTASADELPDIEDDEDEDDGLGD